MHTLLASLTCTLALCAPLAACTDAPTSPTTGDRLDAPQLPPRGAADLDAWLAAGYYKDWHCEPTPHAARAPSPHGTNRICSNDAIATATGTGAYPVGAAAVKELYDEAGASVAKRAVYRKLADGTDGSNWYWFEGDRATAAVDGAGVAACVGCHAHAERDFVFTAVTN